MVKTLCTSGNHEALKCTVHGTSGVIAGLMAAYNIAACCFRRDRHLRVNAVVYSLLVAYELKQALHHLSLIQPAATPQPEDPLIVDRCA